MDYTLRANIPLEENLIQLEAEDGNICLKITPNTDFSFVYNIARRKRLLVEIMIFLEQLCVILKDNIINFHIGLIKSSTYALNAFIC